MVDALGLAETTPGPLILVTQFVAFSPPSASGAVFAARRRLAGRGADHLGHLRAGNAVDLRRRAVHRGLRSNRRLAGALAAITAAVVGVILNLSVWFALHVLFGHVQEQHFGPMRWYAFDPLALDLRAAGLAASRPCWRSACTAA